MRYEVEDGIAVVTFDLQGSKVNTLNMDLADEFKGVISTLVSQAHNNKPTKQPTKPPIKHNPAGSEGGKTDSVSYQAEDVGEEVADEQ